MTRADQINSICMRLHECERELRFSKTEKIDGVWEPSSLNLVAAMLGDLSREVLEMADAQFAADNPKRSNPVQHIMDAQDDQG